MVTVKEAHDRYRASRIGANRCGFCNSKDGSYRYDESSDGMSIEREGWFCNECGDYTYQRAETFSEWAERVGLDYEDDE